MTKRLLDTTARGLAEYNREQILDSIRASEGRVLAAEVIVSAMAAVHDVSNPEVAAAMGADVIVLNLLDVRRPAVDAIQVDDPANVVREVKRLTGRLIAVNLEPVDPQADRVTDDHFGPGGTSGRLATQDNVAAAVALGVDAIVLTGNPGMGVTNDSLAPRDRRDAGGGRLRTSSSWPDGCMRPAAHRRRAAGSSTTGPSRVSLRPVRTSCCCPRPGRCRAATRRRCGAGWRRCTPPGR